MDTIDNELLTHSWLEFTDMPLFIIWLYIYRYIMSTFSIRKNQGHMACIDVMRPVYEGVLY
jgi:hypothetical protein